MATPQNPFKPTAGKTPPELIGRDDVMDEFVDGLDNGPGAPGRLMRITGMRGMGKTAMLNALSREAAQRGWRVIDETADGSFGERILQRLLPHTDMRSIAIQPEALGIKLGGIEFERSAVLLRDAMKRAARKGLLITLDEVQDASVEQTRAVAVAVQHLIREDDNIAFVFAGLPSMVDGVVNSKTLTFLRRAVPFELGPLRDYEVVDSLEDTIAASGLSIEPDVAAGLARAARGYPFMVQLVGYYAWQSAARRHSRSIDPTDADKGISMARRRFDDTVIEPAIRRLSPSQVEFLLAMARCDGPLPSTGEIAALMGKSAANDVSVFRARLIGAGLIDAAAWGKVDFTIPYMRDYLLEHADQIAQELGVQQPSRSRGARRDAA